MRITRKAFAAAVDAAVERRRLEQPVTFRILTIDFPNRTFSIDGRTHRTEHPMVTLPLLSTERPVVPEGGF